MVQHLIDHVDDEDVVSRLREIEEYNIGWVELDDFSEEQRRKILHILQQELVPEAEQRLLPQAQDRERAGRPSWSAFLHGLTAGGFALPSTVIPASTTPLASHPTIVVKRSNPGHDLPSRTPAQPESDSPTRTIPGASRNSFRRSRASAAWFPPGSDTSKIIGSAGYSSVRSVVSGRQR